MANLDSTETSGVKASPRYPELSTSRNEPVWEHRYAEVSSRNPHVPDTINPPQRCLVQIRQSFSSARTSFRFLVTAVAAA